MWKKLNLPILWELLDFENSRICSLRECGDRRNVPRFLYSTRLWMSGTVGANLRRGGWPRFGFLPVAYKMRLPHLSWFSKGGYHGPRSHKNYASPRLALSG